MSSIEKKVNWLVNRPDIVNRWPREVGDDEIIEAMRSDGLIGTTTNNWCVCDFGKLMAEARARIQHAKRTAAAQPSSSSSS